MSQASARTTEPDRFNGLIFQPVTTRGLRIEVQLRKGFSGGIHEWRVAEHRNIDG